jgi:LysM repeat protein
MTSRFGLLFLLLIAASLACSLSTDNQGPAATSIPTPVAQLPTPTPQPTAAPLPTQTAAPTQSTCTPRTSWPQTTVQQGDTLFGIALRVGSTVEELAAANCLANPGAISVGQRLYVPNVPPPPPPATATTVPNCTARWFFTFDPGKADDRPLCPNPVIALQAAGEDFEGGRVIWHSALPGSTDPRGTVVVIYNDGTWVTYVDTWQSVQPESDPGIMPPAGRYQPVRGIGKVWRENAEVRARLGWAYEPEAAFNGRFQEPAGFAGIWYNRIPYFYLDHGKWGLVLRFYSVDYGQNTWEVAGRY